MKGRALRAPVNAPKHFLAPSTPEALKQSELSAWLER
jgi:regulator of sirC expression with transglutaminase-like and TPR domain